MRHSLITIHLLRQAHDATIAQAAPGTQPAEPGPLVRFVSLARCVRALPARTT